ncbi:MAG: alanine--tRNA ligase, partial [Armatimonadetes bacterium]|nr:alanine--tRNA ligase [Armatimonadota bacterium]
MSQGASVDQLRSQFIDFFAQHDHKVMPSASLIPQSPSTLLTGAGMQPFVPAFRGEAEPPASNVVTVQKCVRAGDIEEVGRTARHHTFFEMMGNFSFGGYFKRGAIDLSWELVHHVWGIDAELCWATVYLDDDESADLWHTRAGIPRERILRMGKRDNWWPQTAWDGPCGPCTEIHVDQGPSIWCDDPDKGPASEGDRFLEIWNLVFQMHNQTVDGSLTDLTTPGIDTGLGLERLAAVLQGVPSNFDTDIFAPTLSAIAQVSREMGAGVAYGDSDVVRASYRAIADHLRAVTFMIGDKILPSNEGRGYVLRRILRRAFRFARNLGIRQPFLHGLVPTVIQSMSVGYPELLEQEEAISRIVRSEEDRFCATLEQGLARLE